MIFKYLLNILALFSFVHILPAQVYYISVDANGTGSSWLDASGNLHQILNDAPAGSQIWVAAGTYYPIQCNSCSDSEKNIPFVIPNDVEVYGGFNGTETALSQRNWELNLTVLSGDINQDNVLTNNARTIVEFNGVSSQTILDGFSLIDGYALNVNTSNSDRENSGAAIFNQGGVNNNSSQPKISNCTFSNNTAFGYGGAICNNGSFGGNASPTFENCTFSNNTSELGGGAIYNQASFSGTTLPSFSNCTFENNTALQGSGGAIFNQGGEDGNSNPTFDNCHFEGNVTSSYGGGVYSHGRKGRSNSTFENCTFRMNEARFGGGCTNNGAVNGESNAMYTNCLFEENHSLFDGGGMFNWGAENGLSNVILEDCIFRNNNSDFAGAGMFNNGISGECNATILNCQFISNIATTYGGAIYNHGKSGDASATITNTLFQDNYGSSAGGVYNLGSENGNASPQITNCTFYGNTANVGGAVYSNASDSTGTASPVITNCIFWKNEANFGRVFRNVLGTPLIQYSAVDETECDHLNSGIGSLVTCGEGVTFNVYPKFIDTLTRDLRLASDSPLLNIGDNSVVNDLGVDTDLNHEDRFFNDIVDFGAYEYFDAYIPASIVSQPQGQTVCDEGVLEMEVLAQGTPPLSYQWYKNNSPINNSIEPSLSISIVNLLDAGDYFCQIIGSEGDTVISEVAVILVDSIPTPTIDIQTNNLSICEGENLQLNTSSNGGGENPTYLWYKNDTLVQGALDNIDLEGLNDGDEIIVQFISSANCVQNSNVFDTVSIEVIPVQEALVEIVAPDSVTCFGSELRFQTLTLNGGDNPGYQWYLNGVAIPGQTMLEFTTTDLENNDELSVELTSSLTCVQSNVEYDSVFAEIAPVLEASIDISGPDSVVCLGEEIIFEAFTTNGGIDPQFQWFVNGSVIVDQTSNVFASVNLTNNDIVSCQFSSSEECISNPLINSNQIVTAIDDCTTSLSQAMTTKKVSLSPNPSRGTFLISAIDLQGAYSLMISDLRGRKILDKQIAINSKNYNIEMTVPEKGIYIVVISNESEIFVQKISIAN